MSKYLSIKIENMGDPLEKYSEFILQKIKEIADYEKKLKHPKLDLRRE
jgi:hypothetical protein